MSQSPSVHAGKKRKLQDETQSPGAESSTKNTTHAGSSEASRPKKKKAKNSSDRSSVFAFDASDLRSRSKPISINDLRHAVLAVMEHTPAQDKPKFLSTPSKTAAKRVAVLCIPGITPDLVGMATPPTFTVAPSSSKNLHPRSMFAGPSAIAVSANQPSIKGAPAFPLAIAPKSPETQLPALSKLFSHGLPTRAEGEGSKMYDPVNSFLLGPAKLAKKDNSKPDSSLFGETSTTLESLVMSSSELLAEGLEAIIEEDADELSSKGSPSLHRIANGWSASKMTPVAVDGWARAPKPAADSEASPAQPVVLALDCEMVNIASGKGLARIAVVDFWTEELLMDELVKPTEEILDYVTQYSGITAAMLEPVTTTLSDIQQRLIGYMKDSNAILLGHHLSNDLQALKLAHPRYIDTSVIYHNLQRPSSKASLKWLAQRWLGKAIQAQGQTDSKGVTVVGHRPEEDSRACIALVKLKVEQGLTFGKVAETKTSIFQRLKAAGKSTAYVGGSVKSYGSLATSSVECEEDEVLSNVADLLKTHDFVFGRTHFLADKFGWTAFESSTTSDDARTAAIETFNQQLKDFTASLPPSTALVIFTGCSDPRQISALNKRKAAWDAKIRSGVMNDAMPAEERWTPADSEEQDRACELAKAGLAFFCVTLGAS